MILRRLAAVMAWLDRILLVASVVLLAVAVFIVIVNVASRFVFHLSLPWSAELSRYAIVWSALLAAAVLVHRRQHPTVDLYGTRVTGWGKRWLAITVGFGSLTFYLIVAVSGAVLVWRTAGQVASSIEVLPMPVVYSIVPLSASVMWLSAGLNLLQDLTDQQGSS